MKLILRLIAVLLAMVAFFSALIVGAYMIPSDAVNSNGNRSIEILRNERFVGFSHWHLFDMYSDSLMINMAVCANSDEPIESAMANNYFFYDPLCAQRDSLEVDGEILFPTSQRGRYKVVYGRYWHGHQVFLRPALSFMDVSKIRVINFALGILLLIWCSVLIWRRLGAKYLLCFLAAVFLGGFPFLTLSFHFVPVWFISLMAIIALLQWRSIARSTAGLMTLFMIVGGLTAFMDLFTTPLLTLGFPLVFCLGISVSRWRPLSMIAILSLTWLVGYAGVWAAKWIIGSWITQLNLMGNALATVHYRIAAGVPVPGDLVGLWASFVGNPWLVAVTILVFLGVVLFYVKSCRGWGAMKEYSNLLLIALMPIAWFLVVHNHSVLHLWFTWRIFSLTFFALALYFSLTVKPLSICRRGSSRT